jgi:hypothetical protein
MKKLLLFLFLCTYTVADAQIVDIPDANFKQYLLNTNFSGRFIDENQDREVQVSEALTFTELRIDELVVANFTSMKGIEAFTNVTSLYIITYITELDLSALSSLTLIDITASNLTNLNISGLTNLVSLRLVGLNISSLDLSASSNVSTAFLIDLDYIASLVIGNNTQLDSFYISTKTLTYLDLGGCPNLLLVNMGFTNVNEDIFLNLKNGSATNGRFRSNISFEDINRTTKCYVCIDDGEENQFTFFSDRIILNSYCSFTPGGTYNTINGTFTYSGTHTDCNVLNPVVENIKLGIDGVQPINTTFSNDDGSYSFYTVAGTYIVTPQFENDWFTVNPTSATVSFDDINNNVLTQNFCIAPNGIHPDVEVVILPIVASRPGFDASYKIIYKNKGNQELAGTIELSYRDEQADFISSNPISPVVTSETLTWTYNSLMPFEERVLYLNFNINGPMDTPAVNIGELLPFWVTINPVEGDENPDDNIFKLNEFVVGSFDPNDITCVEGATVNPDKIGEYLHYNINFENTGTAAATFIVVKDIIDAAKFDVNTLQILDASHAMETRVTGNKVEFIFDGINLGAAEKGNVTFKIKTLNTLAVNSEVTQQADIFFDYNWPIQTNEATTTFAILISGGLTLDSSIKVYPNPADGIVTISAKAEIKSVQLYDVQGRLLQSGSGDILDVSNRTSGIYFVKIITDKGMNVEELVRK